MVATGTKTELANTSGKITTKPAACAASAPRTVSATNAKIQLNAKPKAATTAIDAERLQRSAVEAEADRVADPDHQRDDHDVAHEVRQRPAEQHRGPRHRHRAKAVDDAALEILRQSDRCLRGSKGDRLHEDAGQQEVDVGDPVGECALHSAAKHIHEQQHEHDRLDGREDQ